MIDRDRIQKRLTANIRRLLEDRGWSQNDLARASGVPQRTIHQTATGFSMPSVAVASAIAKALGVSLDDLIAPAPRPATPKRRRGTRLVETR